MTLRERLIAQYQEEKVEIDQWGGDLSPGGKAGWFLLEKIKLHYAQDEIDYYQKVVDLLKQVASEEDPWKVVDMPDGHKSLIADEELRRGEPKK